LSTFAPFIAFGPALGLELVVPDIDLLHPMKADPVKLVDAIERFGVRAMFGSPAALEALSRHCVARRRTLRTLRTVVTAGVSLSLSLARRLRQCLPDGAGLYSLYGATESLPISSIESRELLAGGASSESGGGNCVGRPLEENTVRIIPITDEPIATWGDELALPHGTVGEITVCGASTSERYAGCPRHNALAKIREGDRIVHRTGDLGHLDEQGRLWLDGRKSQRVRTPAAEFYTEQVEPIADAVDGVRRSALVGVGQPGAQIPVLCVETEPGADRGSVRRGVLAALARHSHTSGIQRVLFHRGFPVDPRHNSKIIRERLAVWAGRRLR
jgi:acyl-CoA synthetase (AMP-forming)/AMP-acid ligase II